MDRKELIRRYLEAETTCAEERELAESFVNIPPADEEERAVLLMLREIEPVPVNALPDEHEEFDRIVARSRMRIFRTWGLALTGMAAAILAAVLLFGRSGTLEPARQTDMKELLQQLTYISEMNPADADNYEFKPVGDGFVMTAHFPDGQTASYILTPLDGGRSFHLISLNH